MTRFIADSCSDMLQMEGVDFVAVSPSNFIEGKGFVGGGKFFFKREAKGLGGVKRKNMKGLHRGGRGGGGNVRGGWFFVGRKRKTPFRGC